VLPKIILSTAWAEQKGLTDRKAAALFMKAIDFKSVPPASAETTCPKCGYSPADCVAHYIDEDPAETPDRVTGRVYVRCLCDNVYQYEFEQPMDAEGWRLRPAAEAREPAKPPTTALADPADDYWFMNMHDVVRRQQSFYYSNILRGHGSRLSGLPPSTWTYPSPPPEPPPATPPTE